MYMKICFYGAASKEIKSEYTEEAYKLGEELVKRGHELVFGGGENGMMGAVSKGALDNDGSVLGIAPSWIDEFDTLENNCTSFIYTETMDERKNFFLMNSDAFIIAPGGIGTLDEFFEAITLKALNQHDKKIVIFIWQKKVLLKGTSMIFLKLKLLLKEYWIIWKVKKINQII